MMGHTVFFETCPGNTMQPTGSNPGLNLNLVTHYVETGSTPFETRPVVSTTLLMTGLELSH